VIALMHSRSRPMWQGILESTLLSAMMLFGLARISPFVDNYAVFNGVVLSLGAGALWASLRIRTQSGSFWRCAWRDAWVSIALSPALYLGFWVAAWLGGVDANYGSDGGVPLVILPFIAAIPGYLGLRLLQYLFDRWMALRKAYFRWELASALTLVVVSVFILLGVIFLLFAGSYIQSAQVSESAGPVGAFMMQVLKRIFPIAAVLVISVLSIIAVVMPPFALFSYWAARRITRRIDHLATAAAQMRTGNLSARVQVEGQDELAQLQHTFNEMAANLEETRLALEHERDKLEALLKAHRELTAMVSHELRTPVATLRGYLEVSLNRSEQSAEELQRTFEIMDQETARLQKLIDDLFTLSRLDTNSLALKLAPLDPCTIIQRVVRSAAPLAWQGRKVEITAALPNENCLPSIISDPIRLEQILHNLIQNGVRHSLPGGIVIVQAGAAEGGVEIAVQDTGEGIPQDTLVHIFERFYQAPGTSLPGSAGLGLALVREMVEAMGGQVTASSSPGEGSRFSVWLPSACDNSATIS
jgi:signal transduction histidine kinase